MIRSLAGKNPASSICRTFRLWCCTAVSPCDCVQHVEPLADPHLNPRGHLRRREAVHAAIAPQHAPPLVDDRRQPIEVRAIVPPRSRSHASDFTRKYGGSVVTASTLASGIPRRTSRQSPWITSHVLTPSPFIEPSRGVIALHLALACRPLALLLGQLLHRLSKRRRVLRRVNLGEFRHSQASAAALIAPAGSPPVATMF